MTFVIQMRGRHWPESMGWQDTQFQPDDCTPAEWVAKMNDGDPQIEYRMAPVDQVDQIKSLTFNYSEYCLLLTSLIDSRSYYEQLLVASSLHPVRFENIDVTQLPSAIAQIGSMLRRLGVER